MTTQITKQDALKLYAGNQASLARALGVTRQAVSKSAEGPLPELWQLKLRYQLNPEAFGEKKKPVAANGPSAKRAAKFLSIQASLSGT